MKFSIYVKWTDGTFPREEFVDQVNYEDLEEAKRLVQIEIIPENEG